MWSSHEAIPRIFPTVICNNNNYSHSYDCQLFPPLCDWTLVRFKCATLEHPFLSTHAFNQDPCFLYSCTRRKNGSMIPNIGLYCSCRGCSRHHQAVAPPCAECWAVGYTPSPPTLPFPSLSSNSTPHPPTPFFSCVWSRSVCSPRQVQVNKCTERMWSLICINL